MKPLDDFEVTIGRRRVHCVLGNGFRAVLVQPLADLQSALRDSSAYGRAIGSHSVYCVQTLEQIESVVLGNQAIRGREHRQLAIRVVTGIKLTELSVAAIVENLQRLESSFPQRTAEIVHEHHSLPVRQPL